MVAELVVSKNDPRLLISSQLVRKQAINQYGNAVTMNGNSQ